MNVEEAVVENLRTLPPERQQEVLDFVELLAQRTTRERPRRSAEGLWADLGISVAEEVFTQARHSGASASRAGD